MVVLKLSNGVPVQSINGALAPPNQPTVPVLFHTGTGIRKPQVDDSEIGLR